MTSSCANLTLDDPLDRTMPEQRQDRDSSQGLSGLGGFGGHRQDAR
jgi:hypothetical protein